MSEVALAAAMTAQCQAKSATRVGRVPYRPSDDDPQHRTTIDHSYSWEAVPQKVAAQSALNAQELQLVEFQLVQFVVGQVDDDGGQR